jgi:hypothetical protein
MPIRRRLEPLSRIEVIALNSVEGSGIPKYWDAVIERLIKRGCIDERGNVTERGEQLRKEFYDEQERARKGTAD